MKHKPIYLDNQATTPLDPEVRDAMWLYFCEEFGNPHSNAHAFGWEAYSAVAEARAQVAELINANDEEIVFTSGATESCNLALRGVAFRHDAQGKRNRVVTVATEHPAVLETALDIGRQGFEIEIVPVQSDGLLELGKIMQAIDERTLLVSVMAANNEIGVLQPLAEISEICRNSGAIFHTDATQAAGRIPIDVDAWGVDLLSLSSHKVYGPKGVGALFVRSGVDLSPIITGGAQERGLRAGTVPVPLSVGFGVACEVAARQQDEDRERIDKLTKHLYASLRKSYPQLMLFGHAEKRVAGNLNVGLPGLSAEALISAVSERLAVSSGSACASATMEPSHVLLALGLDPDTAATGVRISLGRFTTEREIEGALAVLTSLGIASREKTGKLVDAHT